MQEDKEIQNFILREWLKMCSWHDCGCFHDWEFALFLKEKVRASPRSVQEGNVKPTHDANDVLSR